MTISFTMQVISVSELSSNNDKPSGVNTTIKNLNLLVYTLEVLSLIYLISMDQ